MKKPAGAGQRRFYFYSSGWEQIFGHIDRNDLACEMSNLDLQKINGGLDKSPPGQGVGHEKSQIRLR